MLADYIDDDSVADAHVAMTAPARPAMRKEAASFTLRLKMRLEGGGRNQLEHQYSFRLNFIVDCTKCHWQQG